MPTYVDPNRCDGREALERPACMCICPMDLMKLDTATGKGFKLPIRTTPWGSIEPFPDDAWPDSLDLESTTLIGESKCLGVDLPPTPGAA